MTVDDLITKLYKMPKDAEVIIIDRRLCGRRIRKIIKNEDVLGRKSKIKIYF